MGYVKNPYSHKYSMPLASANIIAQGFNPGNLQTTST
jgi:hypothetical protein